MSAVVLCSANGAPGVTTTTMALAWSWAGATGGRRVLVVDADPAGSGLLPGFAQAGLPSVTGVLGLVPVRGGLTVDAIVACGLTLGDGVLVLPGFADPVQARVAPPVWSGLIDAIRVLDDAGIDMLVDIGRLGHEHQPEALVAEADIVALVVRSNLGSVAGAVPVFARLSASRGVGRATTAVLIGQHRPYSAREVAAELHLPELTVLADDRHAITGLTEGSPGWRWERTALASSAARVVRRLVEAPAVLVGGGAR